VHGEYGAAQNSLDPDLLASGLRDSGDALAGGLIAHRHGSTVNAFLGMVTHRWAKQATNQNLAHVAEALALNQENGTILDALRRVDGSHVVPVYLLSLMHPPQSVELERASNLRELQVEEEEVQQSGEVTPRLFNHRSLMTVQDVSDIFIAWLEVPLTHGTCCVAPPTVNVVQTRTWWRYFKSQVAMCSCHGPLMVSQLHGMACDQSRRFVWSVSFVCACVHVGAQMRVQVGVGVVVHAGVDVAFRLLP